MPTLQTKERPDDALRVEAVRVVERDVPSQIAERAGDLAELERRVSALQNDISQLAGMAGFYGGRPAEPFAPAPPAYFAGLNRFGPVAPGMVPPAPFSGPVSLLGGGLMSLRVGGDAVSTREFSALPYVARQPGINIVDAGDQYIVQVELPNTKKKDLEILGSDRTITLTAQVRPDTEAAEGTVLLGEIAPTVYRRTIALPAPCNTAKSRASLKDGVLTLNVPKKDPSNGMRRIDVAYG